MRRTTLAPLMLAALSFCSVALAEINLVRVTSCGPNEFPADACTIPATGSGNLIVVAWHPAYGNIPIISGMADNAGNVYAQAGDARAIDDAGPQMVDIWYAKNSRAGATAVTISPSVSGIAAAAVVWEFSGMDTVSPLNQTATLNSQPASTVPTGAPVTTSAPSEVIVSVMVPWGAISGIHAGNAFTSDFVHYGVGWAHLITSTASTYAAQWDASASSYASSTVSFRAAASSSGGGASDGSPCDLTADGTLDVADVQLAIDGTLGLSTCSASFYDFRACDVVVVQRVVNAVLGGSCAADNGVIPRSVLLNWIPSISSNAVGYNVYRGLAASGPFTRLNLVAGTSYTDDTVEAGQTYYYVARTVDNQNNESASSNTAVVTIPSP